MTFGAMPVTVTPIDYEQPEQSDIHAEDGYEWDGLQERKLAVKPLTKAEIMAARQWASYK